MDRRDFVRAAGLGLVLGAWSRDAQAQQGGRTQARPAALPTLTVYKSQYCGCCHNWVDHVKAAGFPVRTIDTEAMASVKAEMGVPRQLESCHTVVVGNYLVEGHVPAADIKRMLAEKPAIRGIAVPGMPIGSPGMEQGPVSGYQKYEVIAFTAAGRTSVYARHG